MIGTRGGAFLAETLRALDAELAPTLPRVLATEPAARAPARAGTAKKPTGSAAAAAHDDEAIHDLRVAIRRLRTLMKHARAVYGRFHADAVREGFTTVHRATGALRDEEVLAETLAGIAETQPLLRAWLTRRRAQERALRRSVNAQLRAGDLDRARQLLAALIALPVNPSRDRSAFKLARTVVERARRRVEALRDTPTTDVLGLHALRIAYKELRYSAELFAPVLPADLAAMSQPAARFQKRLGEVHDVDMAEVAIGRARGLPPGVRVAVLGALAGLRQKYVAKYLAEMIPGAPGGLSLPPQGASVAGRSPPPTPPEQRPAGKAMHKGVAKGGARGGTPRTQAPSGQQPRAAKPGAAKPRAAPPAKRSPRRG